MITCLEKDGRSMQETNIKMTLLIEKDARKIIKGVKGNDIQMIRHSDRKQLLEPEHGILVVGLNEIPA
jgi:GTPase Era involved in 16S rRNA processing